MTSTTTEKSVKKDIFELDFEKDGTFKRQVSSFRFGISNQPGARFPPEKGRYVRFYYMDFNENQNYFNNSVRFFI